MPHLSPLSAYPDRRRWMSLVVVCLAQLMIVLDTTIVNVALPSIQHDLHFTQGNLTWVIDAFLVTFGSFLLLAGRLGDLLGRKRVFLLGLTVFTIASVLCGVAPSQDSARIRAPGCRCLTMPLSARPCSVTSAVSCSGQPIRAAARLNADGCGRQTNSSVATKAAICLPMPK